LTSIQLNASAGLRHLQSRAVRVGLLRDLLTDILDQSRRSSDIIERVRALAARRPLERQPLDANDLAAGIVRLVAVEALRRGVTVRAELGASLPAITADRVSLQQVLMNLIINAMDAEAELATEQRVISVRTRHSGGSVEFAVRDAGPGIPADRLVRLFDAFFTTKPDGLGLGLAIARSIVEAHDGKIWAENHDGGGVTFHVALPTEARAPV
jgi:signal transduction histidine kinase